MRVVIWRKWILPSAHWLLLPSRFQGGKGRGGGGHSLRRSSGSWPRAWFPHSWGSFPSPSPSSGRCLGKQSLPGILADLLTEHHSLGFNNPDSNLSPREDFLSTASSVTQGSKEKWMRHYCDLAKSQRRMQLLKPAELSPATALFSNEPTMATKIRWDKKC